MKYAKFAVAIVVSVAEALQRHLGVGIPTEIMTLIMALGVALVPNKK